MNEKRALQIVVAVAGLVPVTAGLAGIVPGPAFLDLSGAPQALTHAAYLSGLLLGIGLAFWSLIPSIEKQGRAFTLLTLIVAAGGLARLITAIRLQAFGPVVAGALLMELVVTPALWAWQARLAARL